MYKSKLQELCQKRSWELPEYTTVKDGPHHMPRFTATVNVRGQPFQTPAECKSSKEAQNTAARIAFEYFNVAPPAPTKDVSPSIPASPAATKDVSPSIPAPPAATEDVFPSIPAPPTVNSQIDGVCPDASLPVATPVTPLPEIQPTAPVSSLLPLSPLPSSLPSPPPGLLAIKNDGNMKPATAEVLQGKCEDTQSSVVYMIAVGSHDKCYKDKLHIYKNQLQQYAQKENLGFPVYSTEAEGPPHCRRFKSKVSIGGKEFDTSSELYPTVKEAEQAVAKVACQALSADVVQEDGGMYKNLLQEFAQKHGLLCPSYETVSSGMLHQPTFASTVTVGTDPYRGAEAKTKKLAEMNAAKVAYCTLTKVYAATKSSEVSSINECHGGDVLSQNIQPATTIKKHHETENEVHLDNKRAKSSQEDTNVDSHPGLHDNPPSGGSSMIVEKQPFLQSHPGLHDNPPSGGSSMSVEKQPFLQWKTVVLPFKANMPIPQNATIMPYSDSQWVAYKVGPGDNSAA